jgi:hypothetical protein
MLAFLMLNGFVANRPVTEKILDAYDLSCYRMKSKTVSHSDYNIWVITNKAALEENFFQDSCASDLNFDNKLVVALKLETETATYKVSLSKVATSKNAIDVYFTTKRLQAPVEEGSPLEMAEISRDSNVKKINFYHGTMLVKSVPLVSVY